MILRNIFVALFFFNAIILPILANNTTNEIIILIEMYDDPAKIQEKGNIYAYLVSILQDPNNKIAINSLSNFPDPFQQEIVQETPLKAALRYSRDPKIIRLLLENGADPNSKLDTITPLEAAIGLALVPLDTKDIKNGKQLLELLFSFKANVNVIDSHSILFQTAEALNFYENDAKDIPGNRSDLKQKYGEFINHFKNSISILVQHGAKLQENEKHRFNKLLQTSQNLQQAYKVAEKTTYRRVSPNQPTAPSLSNNQFNNELAALIRNYYNQNKPAQLFNTIESMLHNPTIKQTINDVDQNGDTLLSLALKTNHLRDQQLITLLLEKGANPNLPAKSLYGKHIPLIFAISNSWPPTDANMQDGTQIIDLLIKHGADINIKNEHDETPLSVGMQLLNRTFMYWPNPTDTQQHYPEAVLTMLLNNGAKLDQSVLDKAGVYFQDFYKKYLKETGNRLNPIDNKPKSPNIPINPILKPIYPNKQDTYSGDLTTLIRNYYSQHKPESLFNHIKDVLQDSAIKQTINRPDANGNTPLSLALETDLPRDQQLITLLLQNGANPNLPAGASIETQRQVPLIFAIGYNIPPSAAIINDGLQIIDLLIKFGADINKTNTRNNGALSQAIQLLIRQTFLKADVIKYAEEILTSLLNKGIKHDDSVFLTDTPAFKEFYHKYLLEKNTPRTMNLDLNLSMLNYNLTTLKIIA